MRLTEAEYEALQARRNAEREPAKGVVAAEPEKRSAARFVLPWPPKELSPNARMHWAALSKVKRKYRNACREQAIVQGAQPMAGYYFRVLVTFVPPDRRKRDRDNLIASMKAGFDGLADALQVDDAGFIPTYEVADAIGGMVRITVEAA